MKKILFITKFEADVQNIFDYTCLLAESVQANITLLNRIFPATEQTAVDRNEMASNALIELKSLAESWTSTQSNPIKFDYIIEETPLIDSIPVLIEEENYDLIAMGLHHGYHFFESFAEDSVIQIFNNLNCDVLIIPEGFRTNKITNIGCTSNFQVKDLNIVTHLKDMSKMFTEESVFHCLYIVDEEESIEKTNANLEELEKSTNLDDITLHLYNSKKLVRKAILSFALTNQLDLMVLTKRQNTYTQRLIGLNDMESDVATNIQVPLLVIKRH